MWRAFHDTADDVFTGAIDDLIAHQRSAPMIDELNKAVEQSKLRHNSNRSYGVGYVDILREAERNNKSADPEFVAQCMKLINGYVSKYPTISKIQFDQGCDYLDEVAKINSRASKGKQHGN